MNIFYYILIWFCICAIIVTIAVLNAKPYPKEWEEEEDKEIERKFKEYDNKKSQDN